LHFPRSYWHHLFTTIFVLLNLPPPVISPDEIVASLKAKLREDELRATLDRVMAEAGADEDDPGLDFESFLNMLRVRAWRRAAAAALVRGQGPRAAAPGGRPK
jgi:hypothetical protein